MQYRHRRRTDHLSLFDALSTDPVARGREACGALVTAGMESALALIITDDDAQPQLAAAVGRVEPVLDVARGAAVNALRSHDALHMLDSHCHRTDTRIRQLAIPLGQSERGAVVLVVADPQLTQRESQAIAVWAANPQSGGLKVDGGACGSLFQSIATDLDADLITLALFGASGMHMHLHARSGGIIRRWRGPSDSIWGEVAQVGSACTIGNLAGQSGTRIHASLGMQNAAIVGIDNGAGLAIGSFGIATTGDFPVKISHDMLSRAALLGPAIMQLMSSTDVPVPSQHGTVDMQVMAARVGCRRFAAYVVVGDELQMASAHASDGSHSLDAPDEHERKIVGWALDRKVSISANDSAAILIGDHTVLYASDPYLRPLDAMRRALQDIHQNPWGAGTQGFGEAGDDGLDQAA